MHVFIPFDTERPKTRLSPIFTADERRSFARAMVRDVVEAVRRTGARPTILATGDVAVDGADVRADDRPLTDAVNAALDDASLPAAVVMADLPLVTADALTRLFEASGDIVLAPGLGGGTNALVSRHPSFAVDYHGGSYLDHLDRAADCGATATTVDSFRLGVDVDAPADLPEVLLHSDGAASEWLRRAGVDFEVSEGRVAPTRNHDGLTSPSS